MIQWGLEVINSIQVAMGCPFMDVLMKIVSFLGNGSVYFFTVLVFYWCINEKKGFALGTGLLISIGVNDVIKMSVKEKRPFQYDASLGKDFESSYSFPSGHSQSAGTFFSLTCNSIGKWYNWIYLILPPVIIGFSRIYLGVHFPHDVMIGLGIGYGIGAFYILGYKKFAAKITQMRDSVKLLLCAVFAFVLLKFGQPESPIPGVFFGFTSGYVFLKKGRGFEASCGNLIQKILRFLIGVTALLIIFLLFRKVDFGTLTGQKELFNFICFFLCGIWVTYGAPLVFKAVGLANGNDGNEGTK